MMKLPNYVLVVIVILGFASREGFAQKNLVSELGSAQTEISQHEAISIAQRHTHGRLLSVQRADDHYRIKILNQKGAVHIVNIHTKSGEIHLSQ